MGALRASELDVYGMEGVGQIYLAYKRRDLESDDEVALIFDPFTFEPLSEPLVNIRFNLDQAFQNGIIKKSTRDVLFSYAKSFYFPERTFERTIAAAKDQLPKEELQRFCEYLVKEKRDFKMEDACQVLQRVREIANVG
jgi:hypothetical protein